MIWLVLIAIFLWGLAKFKGPPLNVATILAGLFVVCLAIVGFGTFTEQQSIAQSTLAQWQSMALFCFVVSAYLFAFGWISARRGKPSDPLHKDGEDAVPSAEAIALERGARHIFLREIGGLGQSRIQNSKVLVIGAGGLGSPVLQVLGAAGVGAIGVIDPDHVERSNLQRQIIHKEEDIGLSKTASAQRAIQAQNPAVEVHAYPVSFGPHNAEELVKGYDLIIDGSDSFDTRYAANEACHKAGKPLIIGALSQWEGQLSLYDTAGGTACYACVFPHRPAAGLVPTCAEAGVFSPLPTIFGSIIAGQALKHISGAGSTLKNKLLIYDGLGDEMRSFKINPVADCPICGSKPQ